MLSAQNAYKTLMDIGGLETEAEYGYDGEDEACKFNRSKVAVRVSGGVEISEDEEEMAKWLLKNGPISIALNAFAMQFYMGGVCFLALFPPPQSTTIINTNQPSGFEFLHVVESFLMQKISSTHPCR